MKRLDRILAVIDPTADVQSRRSTRRRCLRAG